MIPSAFSSYEVDDPKALVALAIAIKHTTDRGYIAKQGAKLPKAAFTLLRRNHFLTDNQTKMVVRREVRSLTKRQLAEIDAFISSGENSATIADWEREYNAEVEENTSRANYSFMDANRASDVTKKREGNGGRRGNTFAT